MYTIYIEYTTNIPIMLVMINLISALGDENLELNTSWYAYRMSSQTSRPIRLNVQCLHMPPWRALKLQISHDQIGAHSTTRFNWITIAYTKCTWPSPYAVCPRVSIIAFHLAHELHHSIAFDLRRPRAPSQRRALRSVAPHTTHHRPVLIACNIGRGARVYSEGGVGRGGGCLDRGAHVYSEWGLGGGGG